MKKLLSKKTLQHASKGTFRRINQNNLKMKSGGHGQENINYLNKKGIDKEINIEYNNGVRLGNVSIHEKPYNKTGNGQAWFPKDWSKHDIAKAGKKVRKLKKNSNPKNNTKYWGTVKKVSVGIYTKDGKITTIFPGYIQKGGIKNEKK